MVFALSSYFVQDDESVPDRDQVSVMFIGANLFCYSLDVKKLRGSFCNHACRILGQDSSSHAYMAPLGMKMRKRF